MDDFEDDTVQQVVTKHAAKSSENDKDALLANGDEKQEEYTGIKTICFVYKNLIYNIIETNFVCHAN